MKLDIIDYQYYDGSIRPLYVLRPRYLRKKKKYKVLYMFDGEATFLRSDYSGKSWKVRKTFRDLHVRDWIAVGLHNAGLERLNEYLPYDIEVEEGEVIESRPELFDPFFIDEIIPFIEENYPVKTGRENRALAGSSMGGWTTAAFASKHKDVFSKYGIFSLASWIERDGGFFHFLEDNDGFAHDASYYIYVGDCEGYNFADGSEDIETSEAYLNESEEFIEYLDSKGVRNYRYVIGEGEDHSEDAWARYFPEFMEMLMED